MKRNLFICLLIIYIALYYYFNYIVKQESNITNKQTNISNQSNKSEPKIIQELYKNTETTTKKIIKPLWSSKSDELYSKPYYIPPEPTNTIDNKTNDNMIEDFLSNCSINKNYYLNINPQNPPTKNTNGLIRNSDGSDNIDYKYTSKMIEGFENLNEIKDKYPPMKTPRNIWVYWENINRTKYPTFIALCLDTMKKHLGTKYNLVILNEKTIREYLPDLRKDFDNLKIAQKVDYYRIELLYKYGGIWIDADIIVMKDLEPIFKKLDEGYDYVGFGCTGMQCSNGKFRPSNWVLASRPNSVLMKKVLDKLNEKLDTRDKNKEENDDTYHDYGKIVIWEALDDLKPNGYDYYHFTSEYDGTRDIDKKWVHTPNFFSTDKTNLLDENKVMFVVLYNSEISGNKKLHWIRDCEPNKIIYSDLWIGSIYRKALGII